MNNKCSQLVISVSVFTLLLLHSGCVRFYRTTDVRNSINDSERKLSETISSIESYKNDFQEGYDYLTKDRTGTKDTPFPQILLLLQKMNTIVDKLKTKQPVAAEIKKDFESLAATFPPGQNVQSDKPGWNEFKPIHARYSALLDELNETIDEAKDVQSELRKISEEYHIGKMNTAELKNQIASFVNEIDRHTSAAGGSSNLLVQKRNEIKTLSDEIAAEIGDKLEIWIMPGSSMNERFGAVKRKAEEANKIIISLKQ